MVVNLWVLAAPSKTGEEVNFTVKSGQTTRQIAANLKKDDLIRSPLAFLVYAKLKGGSIQAGVYKLSPANRLTRIYQELASGKNISEHLVTIPEGWRVTQIDDLLAEKGIITKGDLTRIASSDEGQLFPDTYRFVPKTPALEVRQTMLDNFKKKTEKLTLTSKEIIIASIVEREAKFDEDRPKIARVYLNRLNQGMKLEADPTIQYAKGTWAAIRVSDYQNVDSSYNTYLHAGLPPGPICNPGLKSLEATVYPDSNDYLFFFHKEDGHAVYSKTKEEHDANLKKYRNEL